MYDAPITLLKGQKNSILEVGAGIGYGLGQMVQNDVFSTYTGYEPCLDSFNHLNMVYAQDLRVSLHQQVFDGADKQYDYVFCIEVIEHVEPEKREKMLKDLFLATKKALFISTPDVDRDPHGVYTRKELIKALKDAGFSDVVCMSEQWTNLYIAEVK